MSIKNDLETLGLSPNETKVYVSLLELGLTNVGPIVKKTKLHRMIVYESLDKLINQKLVSFVYKKNRKYFQASNPSTIIEIIKNKEELAKQIVPELLKLQKSGDEQLEVKILYGHEGFVSNLQTVVKIVSKYDKILRIVGGARGDYFYEIIGDWYKNYINFLTKHKVAKWQISPDSNSEAFKEKFAKEKNTILKTMKHGLHSPTLTRITPEMVSIEIYAKETVIIQIYNKAVASSYFDYFNLLWKEANIYKPRKK